MHAGFGWPGTGGVVVVVGGTVVVGATVVDVVLVVVEVDVVVDELVVVSSVVGGEVAGSVVGASVVGSAIVSGDDVGELPASSLHDASATIPDATSAARTRRLTATTVRGRRPRATSW
jgi:hypothetical protein